MQAQINRHKFTSEEFHLMAEAGIFKQDARLELIEGDIIEMAPIGSRHAACVTRNTRLITIRVGGSALVSPQNPVYLREHCEPQPDIAVLRPRADDYTHAHPRPEDILLLIEVCDTTLEYDWEHKVPMYSRWGVPEVWLADLTSSRIEVYRDPSPGGYRHMLAATGDDALSPELLPQLRLTPREILGL